MVGDMIGLAGVDPSLLPIARIGAIYQNFTKLHCLEELTHRDYLGAILNLGIEIRGLC